MAPEEVEMSKRKKEERGRFTARRKSEAVQRLLKGEDLDVISRELGVTAATLSEWREAFLAGAEANLKSREPSAADDENLRLKAKVGELTMELELLRIKAGQDPFPWRKPRG
ncbi:MAG: transposase [Deltaproteobacteria bacterium]|nr:transposase [Deltaproteobacteria bacterium]